MREAIHKRLLTRIISPSYLVCDISNQQPENDNILIWSYEEGLRIQNFWEEIKGGPKETLDPAYKGECSEDVNVK